MNDTLNQAKNIHRTNKPVPGGTMAAVHFGPVDAPVKLVFLHANGFNGLTYRNILEPLGVHVVALDLRGHGRTDLPTDDENMARHTNYAKDLAAYLKAHIDDQVILVGHSLGANAAIIASGLVPDKVTKVLALDPIVVPLNARAFMKTKFGRNFLMKHYPFARNAGRRRDEFSSRTSVYDRYHGRGPFKHFPDDCLKNYITDGFVDYKDGVRLACRPRWEMLTYVNQSQNMKRRIAALPAGSRIIITDFVKQRQGWMGRAQQKNADLTINYYPKKDHFFPITEPDFSREALNDILGRQS